MRYPVAAEIAACTASPPPNVKHMPNDGDLVDLIPLMAPDQTMQKKILVDNPARLYGF